MGETLSLLVLFMLQQLSFKETQLQHARVKAAYQAKEISVKNYFNHKNLIYPGYRLFLRAFKKEGVLEVWVSPKNDDKYHLLVEYDICSASGQPGPKRKEGDRQVPEGVYHINHFNPQSNFHLSLGLNYPNRSDKILGDVHPGSAIYIHGDCVAIGCLPMTDDKIKELYILAVEARNAGQTRIPVHIFPTRLTSSNVASLETSWADHPERVRFWKNLLPIYRDFELTRTIREVHINEKGEYHF